jgi:hypothetical protein
MAPRVAALALVLGTGCRAVFGLEPPDHQQDSDAATMNPMADVGIDACPSLSSVFSTCDMTFDGDVALAFNAIYDTDQRALVPTIGPQVASYEVTTTTGPLIVVPFHTFTLNTGVTLRVVGSKPIALVADGTIDINGTLDLGAAGAAHRNNCDAVAGANGNGGAGGGGGGGFGSIGGAGGDGNSDGVARAGGNGGTAQARPEAPLGGCDGAGGGDSTGVGGPTGKGGGAVMLVATAINVASSGSVDASGGGGGFGRSGDGGGGGGGSGGFILLEATRLQIEGVIVANGGGGGEGGEATGPGNAGSRGLTATSPAPGGAGNAADGGDGGAGGAAQLLAGRSSTQTKPGGGGGGGGGVGFVSFGAPQIVVGTNATVSPGYSLWMMQ